MYGGGGGELGPPGGTESWYRAGSFALGDDGFSSGTNMREGEKGGVGLGYCINRTAHITWLEPYGTHTVQMLSHLTSDNLRPLTSSQALTTMVDFLRPMINHSLDVLSAPVLPVVRTRRRAKSCLVPPGALAWITLSEVQPFPSCPSGKTQRQRNVPVGSLVERVSSIAYGTPDVTI